MKNAPSISHYALYGELLSADDPEFVHIEDISARSLLYEWRIRPHVHTGMFQLVILRTGKAKIWLDEKVTEMQSPCAVVVPSGVVHGFEFEPDTAGQVVTVADAIVVAMNDSDIRKQFKLLQMAPTAIDFAHDLEQFARIEMTLTHLEKEFHWPQAGRSAMLEWLFRVLLLIIRRQIDLQEIQAETKGGRLDTFTRFRQLVEDHYLEHWNIIRYAEELAVTQQTLNRVCRAFVGKGALDIVQERLLLAARRHLIYTEASVEAIAYGIGFQDPAYFSRFFKRMTGMAPGQFRLAREQAAEGGGESAG
jgi:AraC family transcriptional regulator, transcriptional activator of pobA